MSVSGVHVIINLGSSQDRDTMREYVESKYGSVEVIDLTVSEGKLVDKQGDAHARGILSKVGAHSKIIISGQHSSLYGETFQMEADGRDGISITNRTRHFSDVVQFIGDRIKRDQFSSPSESLSISVRSCYSGVGDERSIAAKMQRMLVVAYNIYSTVTARNFLVYIGNPCYSVSLDEYRLIQSHKRRPEDFREIGHQKYNSKMKYHWGSSSEQRVCDAYPYRDKIKKQIMSFCNSINSNNPKVIEILDKLEKSFESPETMGYIYDHLNELKEHLPPKMAAKLSDLLKYAEKHLDVIPKNKEIGPAVNEEERKNFKFIDQILDEKLKGVSDAKIKNLIREHYLYTYKKQMKTDHLDQLIETLSTNSIQEHDLKKIEGILGDFVESTDEDSQILFIAEGDPARAVRESSASKTKREAFRNELMAELRIAASRS